MKTNPNLYIFDRECVLAKSNSSIHPASQISTDGHPYSKISKYNTRNISSPYFDRSMNDIVTYTPIRSQKSSQQFYKNLNNTQVQVYSNQKLQDSFLYDIKSNSVNRNFIKMVDLKPNEKFLFCTPKTSMKLKAHTSSQNVISNAGISRGIVKAKSKRRFDFRTKKKKFLAYLV